METNVCPTRQPSAGRRLLTSSTGLSAVVVQNVTSAGGAAYNSEEANWVTVNSFIAGDESTTEKYGQELITAVVAIKAKINQLCAAGAPGTDFPGMAKSTTAATNPMCYYCLSKVPPPPFCPLSSSSVLDHRSHHQHPPN